MRIILADHNQKTLWALRTILQEEPEMEVVGEVMDSEQLQMAAKNIAVDLVLMDNNLPGCKIRTLLAELHALQPRPTVVVMSSNFEDSRMILKAGADAYVSKADRPDWLLEALRQYAHRPVIAKSDDSD